MLTIEDLRGLVSPSVALGVVQSSAQATDLVPSSREAEFARGREAAFAALAAFGIQTEDISIGANGAPVWPTGVVGSITHTADIAVAVAARTSDRAAIGIDVEREDRGLDPRTLRRIFTESELKRLSTASDHRDRLALFCAKEATYKALSAFVPKLGWHDVDFRFDRNDHVIGELSMRAASFAPIANVTGRVLVAGGFIVVCVEIPAVNPASQVPSARAVPGPQGSN